MYVVWHFIDDNPQLQGIFDKEEDAQNACELYDCYHFIEKNKLYLNTEDTTNLALYRVENGFITYKEIINEGC